MVSIAKLKKQGKKEKEPFIRDPVDRISYILRDVDTDEFREQMNNGKSAIDAIACLAGEEPAGRTGTDYPLFFLADADEYKLSKEVYESAKGRKKELEKKKTSLEQRLHKQAGKNPERFLKGVAAKIGFAYAKGPDTYIDRLVKKVKLDLLKEELSVKGRTIPEIARNITRNPSEKDCLKPVKISKKDRLLSGYYGKKGASIQRKLEEMSNGLFDKAGKTGAAYAKIEDYVGKKVRVYPKGNPNARVYDCGGDIGDVPAGSEGIVGYVNPSANQLMIRFDGKVGEIKLFLKGSMGWIVTSREIKPIQTFTHLSEMYGITEDLAKVIHKKDYKRLVKCHDSYLTEEIRNLQSELGGLKKLTEG